MLSLPGVVVAAIAGAPQGALAVEEVLEFNVEDVYGARRATAGTQEEFHADAPRAVANGEGLLTEAIVDLLRGPPQIDVDVERAFDIVAAVVALHDRDPARTWSRDSFDRATTRWDGPKLIEWLEDEYAWHVDGEMALGTSDRRPGVRMTNSGVDEVSLEDDVFFCCPEDASRGLFFVEESDVETRCSTRVRGVQRALVHSAREDRDGFGPEVRRWVFERIEGRMVPIAIYEEFDLHAELVCSRYRPLEQADGRRLPFPFETVRVQVALRGARQDARLDGPTVTRTRMSWLPRPTSRHDVRLPIHGDSVLRAHSTLTPEERLGFFPAEMASWPQRVLDAVRLR